MSLLNLVDPRTLILGSLIALLGCTPAAPTPKANGGDDHGHAHAEHGPHGGELLATGGHKHHFELVSDKSSGNVILYLLGPEAEEPAAIAAEEVTLNIKIDGKPHQFKFPAVASSGGKSSQFEMSDQILAEAIQTEAVHSVEVAAMIDGKQVLFEFEEHDHSDHDHSDHDHGDEDHDVLVWDLENVEQSGYQLKLGRHGLVVHAGGMVEPAAVIMRDGKPVGDIDVFSSLLAADGSTVVAEEMKTVFEPATDKEEAHYAGAKLAIPADAEQIVIQYRIEFPGDIGTRSFQTERLKTETEE